MILFISINLQKTKFLSLTKKISSLDEKQFFYDRKATSFIFNTNPITHLPQYKIYQVGDVIITEELAQCIEQTLSKIDSGELKTISLSDLSDEEIIDTLSSFVYIDEEDKPFPIPMISRIATGISKFLDTPVGNVLFRILMISFSSK